jgi:adenine/guanine phosphoribosyltransferase-like PRPP-binding protein
LNLSEALSHIREIPDYPKPGIVFKDITPLLSNGKAFDVVIDALCEGLTQVDIVASTRIHFGKRHGNETWRWFCAPT